VNWWRACASILRRIHRDSGQRGLLRAADLEIDLNGHRVLRRGEAVQLSRTEFSLLALLAQHPGQTFSRAQLVDRLHNVSFQGFDRSIDAHIKNLRRKLEPDASTPRYVLTVFGVGYKFTEEESW
jgi:two-component system alkaline phosphatase synthesis response regulator PhoP